MPAKPSIEQRDGLVLLRLRVRPNASRNAIEWTSDGVCRLAVTAPPADGEANAAVCAWVAKKLRVPKSSVSIEAGLRSRDKTLAIQGVTDARVKAALST